MATTFLNKKKKASVKEIKQQQKQHRKAAKGVQLNFQEKLTAVSIKYFGTLASRVEKNMPTLGEDLLKSDYFVAPHAFLSIVLFLTALTGAAAAFGVYMYATTQNLLFIPLVLVPIGTFAIGLSLPSMSRGSRANAVEGELAFVIGYLSVLISGGISPIELFRRLSTSKLFPATAKEARRILMNVDILAMDPISAIDKAARYTPNKILSDFLSGYITVIIGIKNPA